MKKWFGIASILLVTMLTGCEKTEDMIYGKAMRADYLLSSLKHKQLSVDDIHFHYLEREVDNYTNPQVLVLLHGFSADRNNWPRFARNVDKSIRLIIPDLPGHGDTTYDESQSYTTDLQAQRVFALLDKLDIYQFAIAGNSMGGMIAAHMATQQPDRVTHLVLMNSGGADNKQTTSEFELMTAEGGNPLIIDAVDQFEQTLEFALHDPPYIPAPVRNALARRSVAREEINKAIFEDIDTEPRLNENGVLQAITQPTLIMWGDKDRLLDVSNAEIFQRYIEDARLMIMEDIGHMPMLEDPKRSANVIDAFITE